jgi:hypothetical protein
MRTENQLSTHAVNTVDLEVTAEGPCGSAHNVSRGIWILTQTDLSKFQHKFLYLTVILVFSSWPEKRRRSFNTAMMQNAQLRSYCNYSQKLRRSVTEFDLQLKCRGLKALHLRGKTKSFRK